MTKTNLRDELFDLVRKIPRGRCASYGDLGKALSRHVVPVMVGRWMAQASENVPWWRVIGKDGHLPVAKRDPILAKKQMQLLLDEGVHFEGERVVDELWDLFE